jgi:putative Holliday junction resolvase
VRVIGIDLGSKRIGVAVSDRTGTLASPLTVVLRSGDLAVDHQRLAALAAEEEAERMVIGLPLSLSGDAGPAARAALVEAEALAAVVGVPIETFDERLTTVTADRSLREGNIKGARRRQVIDKMAAAVMLQAWLDQVAARRGGAR